MKRLLDFIDGKEPEDDYTRDLAEAVKSVRNNEKWRLDYMTLQMSYQEKFEQGLECGLEQGLEQGIHYLVEAFRDYGHSDEEIKAAIIKKYQLSEEDADSYL